MKKIMMILGLAVTLVASTATAFACDGCCKDDAGCCKDGCACCKK